MRKAPAASEALGQTGFAKIGVVRPEADPLVVTRDGNDAAIIQHLDHAEIVHEAAIIEFTPL
jgi:hypothetical protein